MDILNRTNIRPQNRIQTDIRSTAPQSLLDYGSSHYNFQPNTAYPQVGPEQLIPPQLRRDFTEGYREPFSAAPFYQPQGIPEQRYTGTPIIVRSKQRPEPSILGRRPNAMQQMGRTSQKQPPEENVSSIIKNSSEFMLSKFQDMLSVEKEMMLSFMQQDSHRDQLVFELSKTLEDLNRQNALLVMENKSLVQMLNSYGHYR